MVATSAEAYALICQLNPRQQTCLTAMAIGLDGGHDSKTVHALLARGLIEREDEILPGFLPVMIRRYWVPVHVHIAWAQWASEQDDEEE